MLQVKTKFKEENRVLIRLRYISIVWPVPILAFTDAKPMSIILLRSDVPIISSKEIAVVSFDSLFKTTRSTLLEFR
jgi:hypothetical protein